MTHSKNSKQKISSTVGEASQHVFIPQARPSPWFEKLYPRQREAFEFVVSRPATALLCTPGVGKTYISMAVLEHLRPPLVLIVAPLTSLGIVWRPKLVTLEGVTLLSSIEELVGSFKSRSGVGHPVIVLTNPEALRRHLRDIAKLAPWDMVIWDEMQNCKDRNSINSRVARRLRNVPRRLGLSGTPIDVGAIDLWAQMRFIDYTVLGDKWGAFADEYCRRAGWKLKEWVFRKSKQEQFLRVLKDHVFRLTDEFLNLPPIQVHTVPCEMLGRQRAVYDEMERYSVVNLDGVDIAAHNAGARDVKLSQISGGAVLDRSNEAHYVGRAKMRALRPLLPSVTLPAVIFCNYLHEIDIIRSIITTRYAIIRGSVDEETRTKIIGDFQAGKYDFLICQIRTGGESIDLTAAATLVMYSMTYSWINFEQVIRRLQRGGQTKQVTAYILYCIDTIDETKLDLVRDKGRMSDSVLKFFES